MFKGSIQDSERPIINKESNVYTDNNYHNKNHYQNYSKLDDVIISPCHKSKKKMVPFIQQKDLLPFDKYKKLLIKRTQDHEFAENLPPCLQENRENKDESKNRNMNIKLKNNLIKSHDNLILENKLISTKSDNSNPLIYPRFGYDYFHGNKNKKNKSPDMLEDLRTDKNEFMSTTIGFLCKDEEILCEDFKIGFEKLSNQKKKEQEQEIILQEEIQKRMIIEQEKLKIEALKSDEEAKLNENIEESKANQAKLNKKSKKIKRHYNSLHHKLGKILT